MVKIEKAVIGSVRLDSDVWEAVRAMPESLNQYLRRRLLTQAGIPIPECRGCKAVRESGGVFMDDEAYHDEGCFLQPKRPKAQRRPLRQKGDKRR